MNVSEECFSCLLNQGKWAIEITQVDGEKKEAMTANVGQFLKDNFSDDKVPAHLGTEIQEIVFESTGVKDPLKDKKKHANDVAMELSEKAKDILEASKDRLRQAIRIALAGNLIDFAIYNAKADAKVLEDALNDPLIIDDCDMLEELLGDSKTVLYICDNAGEIVFDKILIEELKRRGLDVTACVKSGPIVNDATMEDVDYVGLKDLCEVITIGAATIGTTLNLCSKEFLEIFESSDLIISKGMANFETLHETTDKKMVFMLKAKCPTVGRYLGVEKNGSVVKVKV